MSVAAGAVAEDRAVSFLKGLGWTVLERNFRLSVGEIDIVARDGDTVVFVEVKARASCACGSPEEFLDFRKRSRLIKTAGVYAHIKRLECPLRFDVVAIEGPDLRHIPDAFGT